MREHFGPIVEVRDMVIACGGTHAKEREGGERTRIQHDNTTNGQTNNTKCLSPLSPFCQIESRQCSHQKGPYARGDDCQDHDTDLQASA